MGQVWAEAGREIPRLDRRQGSGGPDELVYCNPSSTRRKHDWNRIMPQGLARMHEKIQLQMWLRHNRGVASSVVAGLNHVGY